MKLDKANNNETPEIFAVSEGKDKKKKSREKNRVEETLETEKPMSMQGGQLDSYALGARVRTLAPTAISLIARMNIK